MNATVHCITNVDIVRRLLTLVHELSTFKVTMHTCISIIATALREVYGLVVVLSASLLLAYRS